MSAPVPFSHVAEELAEVIQSGDAALVIGAGASVSSGAPISKDLVAAIATRFRNANVPEGLSLLDAGTEVCDTPPYGRMQLVRFLRELLEPLQPDPSYKHIARGRWRGIFTTNYDDLIEKAYQSPGRRQTIQPVHLPYGGNLLPRDNHVLLFYLQGSIKEPPESDGSPVVSRGDYLHTVQIRQASMHTFQNVVATGGTVIYVGYSFGDQFLDDLLDEASRLVGGRNVPYGYAILPDWPEGRAAKAAKITRWNITPVIGTFEDFAALVDRVASEDSRGSLGRPRDRTAPAAGRTLALTTGTATLPEGDSAVQSEYFELLSEELVRPLEISPDEERRLARGFLKGEVLGWAPFTHGWAFARSSLPDVLASIREAARADVSGHDRIVLVHGPAGLGKTVLARQLAHTLYTEDGYIVLIAKPVWRARPDIAALSRVLDDIDDALPEGASLPPVVLFVDEAELLEHTIPPRLLRQALVAGRTLVVVLLARTNEYFRVSSGDKDLPTRDKWGDPVMVQVPEAISEGEIRSLIAHIKRLGLWQSNRLTDEAFWISYSKNELGSSFFDTVYSLVEESQDPLAERVWSEYEHLGDIAQRAYRLIAATHQFGLPLKMEMLVRALGVSFAEFEANVIRGDAREVLFSEYDTSELNLFYRARTRLISGLIFDRARPEKQQQLDTFRQIVQAATGSSMFGTEEIDLIRNLLVQVLGPSGFDKRFDANEQAELFSVATSAVEDDVLEHHYGLIEKDAGRLESARAHLEKALALTTSAIAPRESIQNIENSLGQVLGEQAIERLRLGDLGAAEALFDQASKRFVTARTGDFPNAAAYDAHARMLMRKARMQFPDDGPARTIALSEAIDVISAGIDNVNQTSITDLVELRASILKALGLADVAIDELRKTAESLPPRDRARYELMIARLLTDWGQSDRNKMFRRALPHATLATELDPAYFDAWRLRAEIFERLHPTDFLEIKELLERALECPGARENNWALYELAVVLFYLERYEQSARVFQRLRRASQGHSAATTALEIAGSRTGDRPFEYEGRVVQRPGSALALIECSELAAFSDIRFNPKRQQSYEARIFDRVTFEVAFNYRGLQAVELRKL